MNITLENYEAFLLDFYEGSLAPSEVAELQDFLIRHPELKVNEGFDLVYLPNPETVLYPQKNQLQFDNITTTNYEYFFIAFWEKQLNKEDESKVVSWVSNNPKYLPSFRAYEKCQLKADYRIVHPNKKLLYKDVKLIQTWMFKIGITASISGVILFLSVLFTSDTTSLTPKYTQHKLEVKKSPLVTVENQNTISNSSNANVSTYKKRRKEIVTEQINDNLGTPIAKEKRTSDSFNLNQQIVLDLEHTLTPRLTPFPISDNSLEFINLEFNDREVLAQHNPSQYESNNLIVSAINKITAIFQTKPEQNELPLIPEIKSLPIPFQGETFLAQENIDVRVIRLRILGITVEHTKVIDSE